MKKLHFCLLLIVYQVSSAYAQQPAGINFFKGCWKELLAAAQASDRSVFVDVYTDWCAPCKRMEQEIFVLPKVGAFYNTNFICYRLNAEKGEGPAIAKAYEVSAYPTWLFLNPKGTLRSRRTDYMPAAEFIGAAKASLEQDSVSDHLADLENRFRKGDRTPAFLITYLQLRTTMQLDNSEVLDAFIKRRSTLAPDSADLRFMLRNCGRTWSAAIPLIAGHLEAFSMEERKTIAAQLFENTLYFAWGNAAKNGDRQIAEHAMAAAQQLYPLLNEAQQLIADPAALYHCRKLRLLAGLKTAGYRLAEKQMAIDTTYARQQDKIFLEQVMAPFVSGEQDSTKIPNFAEERTLAATQFSGKVASLLYEVAEAFAEVLPPDDRAQQDAARWAERALALVPNEHTRGLAARLSGKRTESVNKPWH